MADSSQSWFPADFHAALLNSSDEGVVVYDAHGRIQYANLRAAELSGYPLHEIIGRFGVEFIHPEDRESSHEEFLRLAADPSIVTDRIQRLVTADGIRWIRVRIVNLMDDPKVRGIASYFADATAYRSTEQQLLRMQRADALGRTAAVVGHELNNQLTVTLGNLDLLAALDLPEEAARPLISLRRAVGRSADIASRLLAFTNARPIESKATDLSELVGSQLADLERSVPPGIRLAVDLRADECIVLTDATEMEQVVLNVVNNAIDAIDEEGSISVSVDTVSLGEDEVPTGHRAGDYVRLAVADTGRGIAEADLSQVFHPFYSKGKGASGSGLGLAIVERLVERARGFIDIESALDVGTTLTVYLRHYYGEAEPDAEMAPELHYGDETVIVADDEVALTEFVEQSLSLLGYTVWAATTAEEAIALLRSQPGVDLLVTDAVIPSGDVMELIDIARSEHPGLPVLMISGQTNPTPPAEVDFLDKPFGITRLSHAVRECLDARQESPGDP